MPRNPITRRALKTLGCVVRDLRLRNGLSQEELASKCGLDRTYVGGIERGERNVAFLNLVKLAAALDVKPSVLLSAYQRKSRHGSEV